MTSTITTTRKSSKLIVLVGGPGAGKSYVIGQKFEGWNVLDCDSIKAEHPDYDPKDPGAIHAWSTTELQKRIYAELGTGNDFIYDGTGTNVEKYVTLINDAHKAGYEVQIVYVTCSLATALYRNANRERVVPEYIVRDKHATVATAFEILSRYADTVEVVNND